jgi:hypothetical protein
MTVLGEIWVGGIITTFSIFLLVISRSFEVIIINGQYGGCGGTLTLRLNGLLNPDYRWTWFEQENQMPSIICYQRVKTLNLE